VTNLKFVNLRQDLRRVRLLARHIYWSPVLLLIVIAMFAYLGSSLALPYLTGHLIDALAQRQQIVRVELLCVLVSGMGVVVGLSHALHSLLCVKWGEDCHARLRAHIFDHLLFLPVAFFDSTDSGRLLSLFTNDCPVMARAYTEVLGQLAMALLQLLVILFIIAFLFPSWLWVGLILLPVYGTLPVLSRGSIRKAVCRLQDHEAQLSARILEIMRAVAEIKCYRLRRWASDRGRAEFSRHFHLEYQRQKVMALWGSEYAILAIILGLLYLELGRQVVDGHLTVGQLVTATLYLGYIEAPVRRIVGYYRSLHTSLSATDRALMVLDSDPERSVLWSGQGQRSRGGGILINNASFCYPGCEEQALRNVTIRFPFGSKTAIVGPSGSGKTTLLKLILGLYNCRSGCIFLNGRPVSSYDRDTLSEIFGVVHQDSFLFDMTVAENIRLGNLSAPDEAIISAAIQAQADHFIRDLPDGYNTFVGENGNRLSLGQRRRIAIARLMLKAPDIVVLDEPFSGLDAVSAEGIKHALTALFQGRTAIVISHDLQYATDFEQVVVIDRGDIVARGTHDVLMKSSPVYSLMYALQTKGSGNEAIAAVHLAAVPI
jgi:ABC-type multidrug transport system fused ATPase/permease subunit